MDRRLSALAFVRSVHGPYFHWSQIGGGSIPSPSEKMRQNHVSGSSNNQSTCGALAGGESLHEVLLSN
jgi:hypothetical protein